VYRELGPRERGGVTNSLASAFFGSDYTTPVDVRAAGLQFRVGKGKRFSVRTAYDSEAPLVVQAQPVSGAFEPVRPAWRLRGVRAELSQEGRYGEPGSATGSWTWLGIVSSSSGTDLDGARVTPRAVRIEADARMEWPLAGAQTFVLTTRVGGTMGDDLPPQWLQLAGGPWSGPGYAFHELAGRFVLSPRAEWRVPVPFPAIPLGKYGKSPGRMQLIPFAQAVVLGGTSADPRVSPRPDGVYPSAGIGALLFYDLLRVDVSRGLRDGAWRFAIDIDRSFWNIM
jgi:hypothetical protein